MIDDIPITISLHAKLRFKKREKIKNLSEMNRRAKQAYIRGVLVEEDKTGKKIYLFNNFLYVFQTHLKNLILLTVYGVDIRNGLMKIFVQKIKYKL